MKRFLAIVFAGMVPEHAARECDTMMEADAALRDMLEYGDTGDQGFIFELKATATVTKSSDDKETEAGDMLTPLPAPDMTIEHHYFDDRPSNLPEGVTFQRIDPHA